MEDEEIQTAFRHKNYKPQESASTSLDFGLDTEKQEKAPPGDLDLSGSFIYRKDGKSRLILALPDLESKTDCFAILGWKGHKSRETLKSLSALILSTAMYFKALEEYKARKDLFLGLIRIIIGAVDAKDPTTVGHSKRVAELAKELAIKCGLDTEIVDNVYLGGLLHDVGKLGIPDDILNKPGKLTAEEFDVMRNHPRIGGDIMREISLPEIVMHAILEHHERLDGTGYPNKLINEDLTLVGRIVKIADVFDALTSKRQYKEAMPEDQVYEILKEGIGTEFDAKLMEVLLASPFSGPGTIKNDRMPFTINYNVTKSNKK
jgi:putative nucleotidyltransferase with HDIG domain